jgi:hypothetical protein
VSKAFQGPLRAVFWKNVANVLDKEIRASIKGIDICRICCGRYAAHSFLLLKASTFLQQAFQVEYPRLLRLFHDFLSRITVASGNYSHQDFLKSYTFFSLEFWKGFYTEYQMSVEWKARAY